MAEGDLPIRNQQVAGSNPIAGSKEKQGVTSFARNPFFRGVHIVCTAAFRTGVVCTVADKARKSCMKNEKSGRQFSGVRINKHL